MYTRKSHTIENTMKLRFNIFFLYLITLTSGGLIGMEEFCTDELMDGDHQDDLHRVENSKCKIHFHENPHNTTSENDSLTLTKIDTRLKTRSLFNEMLQKSIEEITKTDHLAWQDEQTRQTRLHYAVLCKHKELVEDILHFAKSNSNELLTTSTIPFLDLSDCRGATALHYTLGFTEYLNQPELSGLLAMATLLIEHGASATVQNNAGETPLHYLARYFSYYWNHEPFIPVLETLVKLLSKHGVSPDTPNNYGETALHYAFEQKKDKSFALDMVPILLDHSASVTAQTEDGNTPLHYALALTYPVPNSSSISHFGLTVNLINRGTSPNTPNKWGITPLYLAVSAEHNRDMLVSFLLDKGGDPNAQSKFGSTPLYQASFEKCNKNLLQMLLAKGGNPNIKNHTEKNKGKGGRTMLQAAVCREDIELVKILLDWSHTDPYIKDTPPKGSIDPQPTESRTALEIAKHLQKTTKRWITVYKSGSQATIDEIVELLEWYEHPVIKELWLLMNQRYTEPDKTKSVIPYIIPYLSKALAADNKTNDENNNNNKVEIAEI